MTSKGMPRRRYSSVPPMRRLWPFRLGALMLSASLLILLVSSLLLRGRRLPLECVQVNRCSLGATELIRKWFLSAAAGSAGPSCLAHWTDSPRPEVLEVLVQGRSNLYTVRPFRSFTWDAPILEMCLVGSKALILGTVNSPSLATHQKQVVIQAKMATSRGLFGLSWDLNMLMMSGVKGACWGRLEDGGKAGSALDGCF